ncbi:MAG: heme-binding protein [Acetobacteraceae bacterium]
MPQLTLDQAQTIIAAALKHGTELKMQPLAVVVLDERGVPKAYAAQDGTSLRRFDIASGKAHGAVAFGIGSRALGKRAATTPHFIAAATHAVGGSLVPVPGGVLIRGTDRAIIGAVGISGDTSDNDEAAAIAGIAAAGLTADPGEG